jgi:hypothetical protein
LTLRESPCEANLQSEGTGANRIRDDTFSHVIPGMSNPTARAMENVLEEDVPEDQDEDASEA